MSATLPYWHVDAFAEGPFSGNAAAVVLIEGPIAAEGMQALASELALPATAFVGTPDDEGIRSIHWFDPVREIGLCGHGTLAAGHVVVAREGGSLARFRASDGRLLAVERESQAGRLVLTLPALATTARDLPELTAFLGARPDETRFHEDGYALAVFPDATTIEGLAPDFAALRNLGWQVTATAPADPPDHCAVVSRVFTRKGGEDAATGSAHAALTPYWAARLGRDAFEARQASARGGRFGCSLSGDTVRLAGGCVTIAEGRLTVVQSEG